MKFYYIICFLRVISAANLLLSGVLMAKNTHIDAIFIQKVFNTYLKVFNFSILYFYIEIFCSFKIVIFYIIFLIYSYCGSFFSPFLFFFFQTSSCSYNPKDIKSGDNTGLMEFLLPSTFVILHKLLICINLN